MSQYPYIPFRRAYSLSGIGSSKRMSASTLSTPRSSVHGGVGLSLRNVGSMSFENNDKLAMQNLNDRLSTYLERVRSLESDNARLEQTIREWSQGRPVERDYSDFERTINELRCQVSTGSRGNVKTMLQIDNARLASDDFRIKYEAELLLRQSMEADVMGLRRTMDDMTLVRAALEAQVEELNEELIHLKKSHQEEVMALRTCAGGNVRVEVDAAPQEDLSRLLADIRTKYKRITEENCRGMEAWYNEKFTSLNQVVSLSSEVLESSKAELSELQRTAETLQIDLKFHRSLKATLEGDLQEAEHKTALELQQLQTKVHQMEEKLQMLRASIAQQSNEYSSLLDLKTLLEKEIAQYRKLLSGENKIILKETEESTMTCKVRTIVEEVVNGKVVSSQVEEVEQQI
ncbi:keratin, type I cytoskeletal 17-like [Megalops cyprinoides]|uniref:keratin, type I cytoskeletal 17-like n=1 Tax=Megalops cyprinoides TaxID=118141 RepID=UPI001863E49F|nr:keratin, type I cytoskeletal 17-like [Megalops cyprinoides]